MASGSSNSSTPSTCCGCIFILARSGASSTRIATTTAMGLRGIAVCPEPLHGAAQSAINRPRIPAQFALGLGAGDEHLLASHAYRVQGDPRLTPHYRTADQRVHHARRV